MKQEAYCLWIRVVHWTSRAMDAEATIRCVGKIAKENKNTKNAIKGIVDICDSALED